MKNSNFIFGFIFLFFAVYIANGKDQSPILREGTSVEAVFESVNSSGNLIVVRDYQGLVYLPNWNYNRLGNLFPGKAYHVKTNNEDFLHY